MNYFKNTKDATLNEWVNGELIIEEWVDVPLFEGYYQCSTFGRVKSLARVIVDSNGNTFKKKGHILIQSFDKDKYLSVNLTRGKFRKTYKVHRMVAMCFLKNDELKPEVNHKKGIKCDNRVSQLEWVTAKENTRHAFDNFARVIAMKGKTGALHHASKAVECTTLGLRFGSAAEAKRVIGVSGIGDVCNGNLLHSRGLVFRYI